MRGFRGHIYITDHAKERFIERRLNVTNVGYNTNVYVKMINMIKRSRLVKYLTKEDGRVHEYREYKGCIFVCHREFSKDFLKPDLVTIITVEVTEGFIKSRIERGYSLDSLNLNSYMLDKLNSNSI